MKGSKERLFIRTKTQSANFRGNPLCQATKMTRKQQLNGEKRRKMRRKAKSRICVWLSCCFPVQHSSTHWTGKQQMNLMNIVTELARYPVDLL